MPFEAGHKSAAAGKRLVTSALRRAVVQNPEKLRNACLKILDDAEEGNLAAFGVIADRLEGRPSQSLSLGGIEGAEAIKMEVSYIDPKVTSPVPE